MLADIFGDAFGLFALPVKIKRLNDNAIIPQYQTNGAAAFDLHLCEDVTCNPGEVAMGHTGIAVAVCTGYEMQIRPRSGIAVRQSITVINSPGTIDSDYRGEIMIGLFNHGKEPVTFLAGERVAQGVIGPIKVADFIVVDDLPDTDRGEGGFGSTGQ